MAESLTLVIGTRRYSTWSLRPWLALDHVGAEFDTIEIALRRPPQTKIDILAHSPSGKVPVLIHGSLKVWDSLAICEYVAELFPQAQLWPSDPAVRAVARAVSAEMHSGFQTLRSVCPMDLCQNFQRPEWTDDLAWDVARIDAVWSMCRSQFGQDGPFLFGRFSVADAMFAPVVTRFLGYDLPMSDVAETYAREIRNLSGLRRWVDAANAEFRQTDDVIVSIPVQE